MLEEEQKLCWKCLHHMWNPPKAPNWWCHTRTFNSGQQVHFSSAWRSSWKSECFCQAHRSSHWDRNRRRLSSWLFQHSCLCIQANWPHPKSQWVSGRQPQPELEMEQKRGVKLRISAYWRRTCFFNHNISSLTIAVHQLYLFLADSAVPTAPESCHDKKAQVPGGEQGVGMHRVEPCFLHPWHALIY